MQEKYGDEYENYIYQDDVGAINYTKAGQDMFNNYVAIIEGYLHNVGIVHEDQKENV